MADEPYVGQFIAVERLANGAWLVGEKGRYGLADPDHALTFLVGELAKSPYGLPEDRMAALHELFTLREQQGYWVGRLVDELDGVFRKFYDAALEATATSQAAEAMAASQVALCRVWLDFLQGAGDYQAGQSASPTVLLLWRRYYRALAVLFEAGWSGWPDLEAEYRRALRNWTRVLLDRGNEWFVGDVLARGQGIAQVWEGEVHDLVWLPRGDLRRFFRVRPAEGQRFLGQLTRQWFLPRYDLSSVATVIRSQAQAARMPGWICDLYRANVGMPWLAVGLIALLIAVGALVGGVGQGWLAQAWGRLVVWEAVGGAILVTIGVGWVVGRVGRGALYPFSLRLAAGTFVGLVALSGFNEQFDLFTFNAFCPERFAHGLPGGILLLVISLAAALIYTSSNALSHIGDKQLAWRRSWRLFLFGWAQATVFAAMASWAAAGRLVPTDFVLRAGAMPQAPCHSLAWLGGTLYPDYIIAAGVLAFVVGVFTQILWGERPIPDPL